MKREKRKFLQCWISSISPERFFFSAPCRSFVDRLLNAQKSYQKAAERKRDERFFSRIFFLLVLLSPLFDRFSFLFFLFLLLAYVCFLSSVLRHADVSIGTDDDSVSDEKGDVSSFLRFTETRKSSPICKSRLSWTLVLIRCSPVNQRLFSTSPRIDFLQE